MLAKYLMICGAVLSGLLLLPSARPTGNPVNGVVVRVNDKGDTVYVGNFRKSRLHGDWASWYSNRQRCDSGRLENSLADGTWKVWYPNGKPRFEFHFNARKLQALKDEIRRQPKSRYYTLSQLPPTEAAIHYNARHIFGHQVQGSSSILLSQQVSHKPYAPEAIEKLTELNAQQGDKRYHPPFAEGLLHGTYTSWKQDGSIHETGLYLNGLREGMWEIYREEKVKGVGSYKHGRPFGEWRYYSAQGKLLSWKRFDARGHVAEEHHFSSMP
jgi:antitoxin component YwqK of YwqJK toxin-antitoxin module